MFPGFAADMYLTDPVTIVLSIFTCVFLAIFSFGQKKKVHPNYPPGPPRLPFIGNLHIINISKPYLTFHKVRFWTLKCVVKVHVNTVDS